jgi:hypothetical protein
MASSASSRRPASLTAARVLSRDVRQRWRRDRTFALIHDLNNVYFVLASPAEGTAGCRADAISRVGRLLAGTRWMHGHAMADAWHFIREEVEDPEDAFGPAVLLLALAGRDAAVERWVAALAGDVHKTLGLLADLHDMSPALPTKVDRSAADDRDDGQTAASRS